MRFYLIFIHRFDNFVHKNHIFNFFRRLSFLSKSLKLFSLFSVSLFVATVFLSLFPKNEASFSPKNSVVICVDAGHGGIDNGVFGINSKTPEATLNLEIARLVESELLKLGFSVVMTRTDENGLYGDTSRGFKRRDMQKRKEIALFSGAKLLLSIHCNYSKIRSASGIAVYCNKSSALSLSLASSLAENLSSLSSKAVRIDGEKMFVTFDVGIPAVIVECGFLSNEEDEKKLLDEKYKKSLSKAIAKSVLKALLEENQAS